jgi:DNA-binding NtrC family response regulator
MVFDKLRLMLVDDDTDMLLFLKSIIERQFPEQLLVTSFNDPSQAMDYIENHGPDLVITDLEMPGETGIDLLRAAKSRNAYCQVYLVTGCSTSGSLLSALEYGAADYIVKPVNVKLLERVVGDGIERLTRWGRTLVTVIRNRAAEANS